MTPFEIHQRRIGRQIMAFNAARIARQRMGREAGNPNDVEAIRVAAMAAIAEARATMHLLQLKNIATERDVQDALDWGYQSVLQQLEAGLGMKPEQAG